MNGDPICRSSTASRCAWSCPGYFGTWWVKHLNEITVAFDNVHDGFWMKSCLSPFLDTPKTNAIEPGHRAEGDQSRSICFNHPLPSSPASPPRRKLKSGDFARLAARHRLRRRQGHQGSRGASLTDGARPWTKTPDLGKVSSGKYSFREMEALPVKLVDGLPTSSRSAPTRHMAARRSRMRAVRETRRVICATSSKPSASAWLEEHYHAAHRSPCHRVCHWPCLACSRPRHDRGSRQLPAPRRDRRLQAGPQS